MNSTDLHLTLWPKAPAWATSRLQWVVHPLLLVTFITGVGALLRLYNLGQWSLWIDEVLTIRSIYTPLFIDPPRLTYSLVWWSINRLPPMARSYPGSMKIATN